ncbi:MAG: glycosyltransferase [Saprospiraceae bacterium]
MKKVVSIVLNNFLFDSRVLKECHSLQSAGYQVSVVALHEGELKEQDEVQGIPVHRIRLKTRNWGQNRFIQLIKFIELFFRIIKDCRKADIIHCNDILPLPISVICKYIFNRKAKIVYDAHELEFDQGVSTPLLGKMISLAEKMFIRHADRMMTVSALIADAYVEEYGIDKPVVVMNCPKYTELEKSDYFRKKFGIKDHQTIALYQGGLSPHRGVEQLIEVFKDLPQDYALVFLGFGILKDIVTNATQVHDNIFYHDPVPPDTLLQYTTAADVGFLSISNTNRNHDLTIGNKIFQYIMAGLPVISFNLQASKWVLNPKIGFVLEHNSNAEILAALQAIKTKGLAAYQADLRAAAKEYCWEKQEVALLQLYRELHEA